MGDPTQDGVFAKVRQWLGESNPVSGLKSRRHNQEFIIGETDIGTVIKPHAETAIAIRGDTFATGRSAVAAVKIHSALIHSKESLPTGVVAEHVDPTPLLNIEHARKNLLIIDNAGGPPVTIHVPGEGAEVKLDAPDIVVGGGLIVDFSGGKFDNYTGHPLSIYAGAAKGPPAPVHLMVDKEWELKRASLGLTTSQATSEGFVTDGNRHVIGFRNGNKGPVVYVQPGQEMIITAKAHATGFIFHPAHKFRLKGGMHAYEALERLQEQIEDQKATNPEQTMGSAQKGPSLTMMIPQRPVKNPNTLG